MSKLICKDDHMVEQVVQQIENILTNANMQISFEGGKMCIEHYEGRKKKSTITYYITNGSEDFSSLPRMTDEERIWRYKDE